MSNEGAGNGVLGQINRNTEALPLQPSIPEGADSIEAEQSRRTYDTDALVDQFAPQLYEVLGSVESSIGKNVANIQRNKVTEVRNTKDRMVEEGRYANKLDDAYNVVPEIPFGSTDTWDVADVKRRRAKVAVVGDAIRGLRKGIVNTTGHLESYDNTLGRLLSPLVDDLNQISIQSNGDGIATRLRRILSEQDPVSHDVLGSLYVYRDELANFLTSLEGRARQYYQEAHEKESVITDGSISYAAIKNVVRDIPIKVQTVLQDRDIPENVRNPLGEVQTLFNRGSYPQLLSIIDSLPLSSVNLSNISQDARTALEDVLKIFEEMAGEIDKPKQVQDSSVDITK